MTRKTRQEAQQIIASQGLNIPGVDQEALENHVVNGGDWGMIMKILKIGGFGCLIIIAIIVLLAVVLSGAFV